MLEFQNYRCSALSIIEVISLDLDQLIQIAEQVNSSSISRPFEGTKAPDAEEDPCASYEVDVSRCTVPIAMICFSVIDMFGQWIKEPFDDDFGTSAKAFFEKLANKDDLKKAETAAKLKEYYRNNMMHSFFAYRKYGVAYPDFDQQALFLDWGTPKSTLNVRYLSEVVRQGLSKLRSFLTDEHLEITIKSFEGYKKWLNKNECLNPH